MELRHLKLVQTVARTGTLTKAGEQLHLTQSAMSHQLKELEGQLGTALFHRINKQMVLTPAGEMVLKTAEKVLQEVTRTEHEVQQLVAGDGGQVRLSTECYTCYHWLPPLLKKYTQDFSKIDIQIVAEATRQPLQALYEGKLDLAICSEVVDDAQLLYTPLFTDELVVAVSPEHPFQAKPYVTIDDFQTEHLILYSSSGRPNLIFEKFKDIRPQKVSKMQLTEAIVEMVKAGLGISVLARWAIKPQLDLGQLVAIPISESGLHRTWYAVTLRKGPQFLGKFVEHLVAHSAGFVEI